MAATIPSQVPAQAGLPPPRRAAREAPLTVDTFQRVPVAGWHCRLHASRSKRRVQSHSCTCPCSSRPRRRELGGADRSVAYAASDTRVTSIRAAGVPDRGTCRTIASAAWKAGALPVHDLPTCAPRRCSCGAAVTAADSSASLGKTRRSPCSSRAVADPRSSARCRCVQERVDRTARSRARAGFRLVADPSGGAAGYACHGERIGWTRRPCAVAGLRGVTQVRPRATHDARCARGAGALVTAQIAGLAVARACAARSVATDAVHAVAARAARRITAPLTVRFRLRYEGGRDGEVARHDEEHCAAMPALAHARPATDTSPTPATAFSAIVAPTRNSRV